MQFNKNAPRFGKGKGKYYRDKIEKKGNKQDELSKSHLLRCKVESIVYQYFNFDDKSFLPVEFDDLIEIYNEVKYSELNNSEIYLDDIKYSVTKKNRLMKKLKKYLNFNSYCMNVLNIINNKRYLPDEDNTGYIKPPKIEIYHEIINTSFNFIHNKIFNESEILLCIKYVAGGLEADVRHIYVKDYDKFIEKIK